MLFCLLAISLFNALPTSNADSLEEQGFQKVLWTKPWGNIPKPPNDSILLYRAATALIPKSAWDANPWTLFVIRVPFILFGLWLGGALWWVTRRLYNNAGGYIALALFCSSAVIVSLSSHVNSEILAAWGLFGIVYTASGVAHTLYAPPQKWRARIVLLGTAFGITAAAHLSAAIVGLILAAFFMLYLAPERRIASLVILAEASIIAFFILWAFYGFSSAVFAVTLGSVRFEPVLHSLSDAEAVALSPFFALLIVSVMIFIAWPRTRYFGNWAPLVAFLVLMHLNFAGEETFAWALPFAFVFVGGILSDVLETRWRRPVVTTVIAAVCAQEVLALLFAGRAVH